MVITPQKLVNATKLGFFSSRELLTKHLPLLDESLPSFWHRVGTEIHEE